MGIGASGSDSTDDASFEKSSVDYYMVDAEHGLINPEQMAHVVRACEAVGVTPMARIGRNDPKQILAHLDAGMQGLMIPGLDSAESLIEFYEAEMVAQGWTLTNSSNIGTPMMTFEQDGKLVQITLAPDANGVQILLIEQ